MSRTFSVAIKSALVTVIVLGVCLARVQPASARDESDNLTKLNRALKLLTDADKDYDGHRAKAVEIVNAAIKSIGGKPTKPSTTDAADAKSESKTESKSQSAPPATGESQPDSDQMLRDARSILAAMRGKLSAKHAGAGQLVGGALLEINAALKVK